MSPLLQQRLYDDFPELFIQKDLPPRQTCMCWGIDCDDGWFKLIYELCFDLQQHVNEIGSPQVEAGQVKQKLGTLCFYLDNGNDYCFDLTYHYEERSKSVCEICGKPGKIVNLKGWITPRCPEHST